LCNTVIKTLKKYKVLKKYIMLCKIIYFKENFILCLYYKLSTHSDFRNIFLVIVRGPRTRKTGNAEMSLWCCHQHSPFIAGKRRDVPAGLKAPQMKKLTQTSTASPTEDGRRNEWLARRSTKGPQEGRRKINKL